VHFKHEKTPVISRDSHVTIGTIQQDGAKVLWVWRHYGCQPGIRLGQRSYWDSWKLVGRHCICQHGIWL